ncbi:DNA polymerase IV, dinB [Deinococcus aerius]|uniref:DNA polymerase IV, dinB n=1 Tax=Deinococcus aerius TaxID=200253 RepID=A0A2I9D0D4_9DEIO|nr:hypothetical protein [Deinococcus aerius]GBF07972.1 DNA polymerase IV, dinB [Deinococcus aerius]
MTRLVVHVDMNAFYVSVEVRDQPELREKPVAVIVLGRRGVVLTPELTAGYWVRPLGVSAVNLSPRAGA